MFERLVLPLLLTPGLGLGFIGKVVCLTLPFLQIANGEDPAAMKQLWSSAPTEEVRTKGH